MIIYEFLLLDNRGPAEYFGIENKNRIRVIRSNLGLFVSQGRISTCIAKNPIECYRIYTIRGKEFILVQSGSAVVAGSRRIRPGVRNRLVLVEEATCSQFRSGVMIRLNF